MGAIMKLYRQRLQLALLNAFCWSMTALAAMELAGIHPPPGIRELALALSLTPIPAGYFWWQAEKRGLAL